MGSYNPYADGRRDALHGAEPHAGMSSWNQAQYDLGYATGLRERGPDQPYAQPIPAPAYDEWQPIETAPKDGRTIIIHHCDGRILEALFDNVKDGWVGSMCGLTYREGVWNFTHWMSLPAAPQ